VDRVFVYTPKGEIKELPKGATPLDFAFRIHTDLGYRCIGAKVNGRLEPLNYALKNGDVVEIMASKVDKGPSLDWLNPELGYH
jgi:GTP diphosphokinase / guanosine-3',5'-bis(diphosphate) 3'-diphosphatase